MREVRYYIWVYFIHDHESGLQMFKQMHPLLLKTAYLTKSPNRPPRRATILPKSQAKAWIKRIGLDIYRKSAKSGRTASRRLFLIWKQTWCIFCFSVSVATIANQETVFEFILLALDLPRTNGLLNDLSTSNFCDFH